jgi:hypothetical protein
MRKILGVIFEGENKKLFTLPTRPSQNMHNNKSFIEVNSCQLIEWLRMRGYDTTRESFAAIFYDVIS